MELSQTVMNSLVEVTKMALLTWSDMHVYDLKGHLKFQRCDTLHLFLGFHFKERRWPGHSLVFFFY